MISAYSRLLEAAKAWRSAEKDTALAILKRHSVDQEDAEERESLALHALRIACDDAIEAEREVREEHLKEVERIKNDPDYHTPGSDF